jgi:hypothetical protein
MCLFELRSRDHLQSRYGVPPYETAVTQSVIFHTISLNSHSIREPDSNAPVRSPAGCRQRSATFCRRRNCKYHRIGVGRSSSVPRPRRCGALPQKTRRRTRCNCDRARHRRGNCCRGRGLNAAGGRGTVNNRGRTGECKVGAMALPSNAGLSRCCGAATLRTRICVFIALRKARQSPLRLVTPQATSNTSEQ